jgi:hypothetical protein
MIDSVFDAFVKQSPITVMARGMMERVLNPERLDELFDQTAEVQYTRNLLFSSVFNIMSRVVCGHHRSVNDSFLASKEEIGVSITSVYNKLQGIETRTSAELVRYASREIQSIIEKLGGGQKPLISGFRVKLLDGNCISATEHRLENRIALSPGLSPPFPPDKRFSRIRRARELPLRELRIAAIEDSWGGVCL